MSDLPEGCQAKPQTWRGHRNWQCTACGVATLDDRVRDAYCQALEPNERAIAGSRSRHPIGWAGMTRPQDDPVAHNPDYMTAQVADDPNTDPAAAEPRELGGGWFEIAAGPRRGERVQGRQAAVDATEHPTDDA